MQDGRELGVFKGHKRGLWALKFSPIDQVLATCSTDKSIKLWNISDFSCIKTFEGHLNTVLDVSFMSLGLQLISAGSDGLVKVWDIKSAECTLTLDEHADRIWALELNADESQFFSGSADSSIVIWSDTSDQEKREREVEEENKVVKKGEMDVFERRGDWGSAMILAMELDSPMKLLSIMTKLNESGDIKSIEKFVGGLEGDRLVMFLKYLRDWNTHSRHAAVAQCILNLVLKTFPADVLLELPGIGELIDALGAYTQRHYEHANDMMKGACVVGYCLESMDLIL